MAPKVDAAIEFVEATGGIAAIGALRDVSAMIEGRAGTVIDSACAGITWWEQA